VTITRRILDGAKDSWGKLTSLVIVDDEPLSHVDASALAAELAARRAARERGNAGPGAAARIATSAPAAHAERVRLAAARASKVHGERERTAARAQASADDAFARMKAQAGRPSGSSSSSAGSGGARAGAGSSSGAGNARPRPTSGGSQVAEWYKVLDVEPGADLTTIKGAYRRLMRKYHPDVHAGDPKKLKAATELSMRVTTAYNGLVAHLEKR
jgi:DnaJ-domain-containing protein 1